VRFPRNGVDRGAVIVYFIVTFSRRCLSLCGSFLVGKLEFSGTMIKIGDGVPGLGPVSGLSYSPIAVDE